MEPSRTAPRMDALEQRSVARFVPEQPFPAYAYVPGHFPHPLSDPRGHSFGARPERPAPLDPERWRLSRPYLYGIDLFNHGYYWEAHEVWEGLWHACGRSGQTGRFLQGLIKLAAAGVKVRQGMPQGVKNHARRATQLFQQVANELGGNNRRYLGLSLGDLVRFAGEAARTSIPDTPVDAVKAVFNFVLWPAEPADKGNP